MGNSSRLVGSGRSRQAADLPYTPARALVFHSRFGSPRCLLHGPPLEGCYGRVRETEEKQYALRSGIISCTYSTFADLDKRNFYRSPPQASLQVTYLATLIASHPSLSAQWHALLSSSMSQTSMITSSVCQSRSKQQTSHLSLRKRPPTSTRRQATPLSRPLPPPSTHTSNQNRVR